MEVVVSALLNRETGSLPDFSKFDLRCDKRRIARSLIRQLSVEDLEKLFDLKFDFHFPCICDVIDNNPENLKKYDFFESRGVRMEMEDCCRSTYTSNSVNLEILNFFAEKRIPVDWNVIFIRKCTYGFWKDAEFCLGQDVNINATDVEYATALMHAAQNGRVEIVKNLLDLGADPTITKPNGRDALFYAGTCYAIRNIILEYIRKYQDWNEKEKSTIDRFWQSIIADCDDSTFEKFLKLELPIFDKELLVLEACQKGKLERLRYFREKGAEFDFSRKFKGYVKTNPLTMAVLHREVDVVKFLFEECYSKSEAKAAETMSTLFRNGRTAGLDKDIFEYFMETKFDVNHIDELTGKPFLNYAARLDDSRIMEKLLTKENFNINIQDKEGMTPLMESVRRSNFYTVKLLLKAGADPSLLNHKGKSAYDYATTSSIKKLLRPKSDDYHIIKDDTGSKYVVIGAKAIKLE
jgi:ankyrin repeat protein